MNLIGDVKGRSTLIVDDIIDTDEVHYFGDVHVHAALVHDGQRRVEFFGEGAGTLHTARIGRDYGEVRELHVAEVFDQHGRAVEGVHRNVEIALNLGRMQIERKSTACGGGFQQGRNQLGGYRDAGLVFAVLPRIAVIRENSGDAPGGRAFERVNHEQQFEQVAVHRERAGLHDEDIGAAHVFKNLKINFTIAEPVELALADPHVQMPPNAFAQNPLSRTPPK